MAVELAALALQCMLIFAYHQHILSCHFLSVRLHKAACIAAELGDFEEEDHTPAVISEFRFMPEQTEEMELDIYNKYKSLRLVPVCSRSSRLASQLSIILPLITALFASLVPIPMHNDNYKYFLLFVLNAMLRHWGQSSQRS